VNRLCLNKCIGDDTKAAARLSLSCIKTKKIKYGEKRFSIWRIELLHPAIWHVALESWHWIRQNVRHIGILHLVLISTTSQQSRCHILHQSPKFYPNWTTLNRKKWRHVDFSRWRISAILDFRDPIMGSLKSLWRTSYYYIGRQYIDHSSKLLSFWENRVFFAFWRQTDKQTNRQKNRWTAPMY